MNMLSHYNSLPAPPNYFTIELELKLIDKINTHSTDKIALIKYWYILMESQEMDMATNLSAFLYESQKRRPSEIKDKFNYFQSYCSSYLISKYPPSVGTLCDSSSCSIMSDS